MRRRNKSIVAGLILTAVASIVWAADSKPAPSQANVDASQSFAIPSAGSSFQDTYKIANAATTEERTLVAATTAEYPVTPGDTYSLNFLKSTELTTLSTFVELDYQINLAFFGRINTRGLTFRQLKEKVEASVERAYPGSSPSMLIQSTGVFDVKVEGEVKEAGTAKAWGLTRLSTLVGILKTDYASTRRVRIRAADGVERSFDLFKASRFGDLSQNPYVRPGDTIVLDRYDRLIVVSGAVHRPGAYELLPAEGLREAVSYYADGLLPSADGMLSQVSRPANGKKPEGAVAYFDALNLSGALPALVNGDVIFVPSLDTRLPVVYFEGAIASKDLLAVDAQGMAAATTQGPSARQVSTSRYTFKPGDRLSRALQSVASLLLPTADLRRSFIARKGSAEVIPVDLEKLLYAYSPRDDIELQAEDRIVIPFGSLDVFVTGEVSKSTWVNTAAVSRLSSVLSGLWTPYSSNRDVTILGANGDRHTYDLFRAERYGELQNDPFLKPGDVVSVAPAARIVTVSGEVRRPGRYQLLPGEGLRNLVEEYAGGFTEKANPGRISQTKIGKDLGTTGSTSVIDYASAGSVAIDGFDTFTVPSMKDFLSVIWFEGAVGVGINGEDPQAGRRIPYTFIPGETLSHATQALRTQFSAVADLPHAYIVRGTEKIAADLSAYLYTKDYSKDHELEAGDIILVPFRQFFVSVQGAVYAPGRYPYIPDRDWSYYVGLAGGLDKEKNSGDAVTIFDVSGKKMAKSRPIQPEDSIRAESNSFLFFFSKVSTILTTAISIAALVTSLLK